MREPLGHFGQRPKIRSPHFERHQLGQVDLFQIVGRLPHKDKPLPRFLDDAAMAKLLVTARNDPDPFVRL
ncbi:MAG: hypothetical protein E6I75_21210 [Chloroflexi bacterium]|nr:MAG: hypothetical protein E6I75_21210 [Chloroflexota bacterium]